MRENSYISNFKIITRLIIFIIVVTVIFSCFGKKYKQAADLNVVNAYTKSRFDDFYALEKDSLDMVFVGSSHSYCTFDPERIEKYTGLKSFQMGTPLQHADTTYYELKEIFKYQKPRFVVMELYWDVIDDDFEPKQADSFFEVLKDDDIKKEYIKKVFPLGAKVKYALAAIRYQQEYFAYMSSQIEKEIAEKKGVAKKQEETNGTEYYRSLGYTFCDTVLPKTEYDETNQFKGLDGNNWQPSKTQLKYIRKLSDLCRENGAKLIMVTAPIANVSMEYIKNYDKIHSQLEKISEYALEEDYIDYNILNSYEHLLENENFRDDAHLNDSGVEIVDKHFSKWLKGTIKGI